MRFFALVSLYTFEICHGKKFLKRTVFQLRRVNLSISGFIVAAVAPSITR